MTGRILHPNKKRADASTLFRCRPKASTAIDYFLSKSSVCLQARPPVETTRSRPPNLAKYSSHHGRKERDGRPEEQPPLRRTQARRLAASIPLIHASIPFVPKGQSNPRQKATLHAASFVDPCSSKPDRTRLSNQIRPYYIEYLAYPGCRILRRGFDVA